MLSRTPCNFLSKPNVRSGNTKIREIVLATNIIQKNFLQLALKLEVCLETWDLLRDLQVFTLVTVNTFWETPNISTEYEDSHKARF